MLKRISGMMAVTALLMTACQKDTASSFDCTGVTPTYTADIKAIMDTNCATSGCHNATSKAKGINLSTYALVKSESGNARFLGSMEHLSGYDAMPEGKSKLSDAILQKVYCWIENGQPE